MRKYIVLFIILFIHILGFSQPLKPKYGVELASTFKKIDTYSMVNSPALSGYIGIYTYIPFKTERFSAKLGTGLNFTSIHRGELRYSEGNTYGPGINTGEDIVFPEINTVLSTLSVSAELRYYIFPDKPSWGNLYATIPFIFETKPFTDSWILRSGYRVIPGIGYRYAFSKHWTIEASAGIGKGYLKSEINAWNNKTMTEFSTILRIGYTF